jgi:peptidoglycan/xylan/chitin deacetylase (PgdA/CDA1 family)
LRAFDVRRALREAVLAASYRLGASRVADALGQSRVVVLMYHGVPADDRRLGIENWHGYNVALPQFSAHMEYLARRCHVVALRDALAGRNLAPRRTNVVLTFDDGYENNYVNAFPVLRRLGLPATFAIATAFVLQRRPLWNDALEFAVGSARPRRGTLAWGDAVVDYDTENLDGRLRLFRALWQRGVDVEQSRRDALMARVAEQLDVPIDGAEIFARADYRPLDATQIGEMVDSGLAEVCSHSVHHYALPRLAPAVRRAELARAKTDVEKLSGRSCDVLCLPGGLYDAATLDDAFGTGHAWVLTSDRRDVEATRRVVGRYVVVRSHTMPEFAELVHAPVRRLARRLGVHRGGSAA